MIFILGPLAAEAITGLLSVELAHQRSRRLLGSDQFPPADGLGWASPAESTALVDGQRQGSAGRDPGAAFLILCQPLLEENLVTCPNWQEPAVKVRT